MTKISIQVLVVIPTLQPRLNQEDRYSNDIRILMFHQPLLYKFIVLDSVLQYLLHYSDGGSQDICSGNARLRDPPASNLYTNNAGEYGAENMDHIHQYQGDTAPLQLYITHSIVLLFDLAVRTDLKRKV
jgi:hypothetical protein